MDGSGDVDGIDLFNLSKAYGSMTGDADWNPNLDLNDDGEVDTQDLSELSKNYGKTISENTAHACSLTLE